MGQKTENIEITVKDKTYEVLSTYTNTAKDTFEVELGLKDDEDSLIEVTVSLDDIYDELADSGECDAFIDAMDSNGEHTTVDSFIDPADVWKEYSHAQQIEFVNEDIIKHLKTL